MTTAISPSLPAQQAQCFPCKVISDLCQAVYDIAMKIIRAIGDCFSSAPPVTPLNPPTTTLSPLTQRVTMSAAQNLVPFYRGLEANNRGVTLNQILGWDDERLEQQHDYIQWLFPLRTPSGPNPTAAVLDEATINTFRTDPALQNQVLASFRRMLTFYGLQMDNTTRQITRAPNFNARAAVWLTPGNHNFLRITRMIQSLHLLGLPDHSRAFFAIMQNIAQNEGAGIVGNSLGFWQGALPRS